MDPGWLADTSKPARFKYDDTSEVAQGPKRRPRSRLPVQSARADRRAHWQHRDTDIRTSGSSSVAASTVGLGRAQSTRGCGPLTVPVRPAGAACHWQSRCQSAGCQRADLKSCGVQSEPLRSQRWLIGFGQDRRPIGLFTASYVERLKRDVSSGAEFTSIKRC